MICEIKYEFTPEGTKNIDIAERFTEGRMKKLR